MSKSHMFIISVGSLMLSFGSMAWAESFPGSMTKEVIPPGQEALIKAMLSLPEDLASRTGCAVQDIKVGQTKIDTRVACKTDQGPNEWDLEMTHVKNTKATGAKIERTARFTVAAGKDANVAVFDNFVRQIKAQEETFRWVAATRGMARKPSVDKPPSDLPAPVKVDGDADDPLYQRYIQGYQLFEDKQHVKAFEFFVKMAQEHPDYAGVLGMLVANLAPQKPDADRVQQFVDAADRAPDSPLDSFLAGVSAHYSAHYIATSKAAKTTLYQTAITYLEKTRPAYDFEPRVFIYLSVSHFRLGHQKKAEELIEKAVLLNRRDPDAYYCRAEVFHRTKPARAIEDIDKYLALTKIEGGVSSGKVKRVEKMREYLVRVTNGETQLTELWDPIVGNTYEVPALAEVFTDPKRGLVALVGLAVALFLLSFAVYYLRKKFLSSESS